MSSHHHAAADEGRDRDTGNPFRDLLGVRLTATGPGTATVVIDPVPASLLQGRGIVHGGVYATLIDCAAGEAVRTVMRPDEDGFTVDLNITYLRPVVDSALKACGRAVTCGRSVAVAVADIYDGSDVLVATGRATFAVRARGRVAVRPSEPDRR